MTLLLTNHWVKLIRMPGDIKNMEYLHSSIQKGRSAKIAWKAYENIEILTLTVSNREREHADSGHQCPSQYLWHVWSGGCMSAACRCPDLYLPYLEDIFVGNTYYAIPTFGTKIGSGQMSVNSWKTELVTPCCHNFRYLLTFSCTYWYSMPPLMIHKGWGRVTRAVGGHARARGWNAVQGNTIDATIWSWYLKLEAWRVEQDHGPSAAAPLWITIPWSVCRMADRGFALLDECFFLLYVM